VLVSRLQVSGEQRRWEEGKSLLFDDSFLHEVRVFWGVLGVFSLALSLRLNFSTVPTSVLWRVVCRLVLVICDAHLTALSGVYDATPWVGAAVPSSQVWNNCTETRSVLQVVFLHPDVEERPEAGTRDEL